MFMYPIVYQDRVQGQYVRAGFEMKDSVVKYHQVIQPQNDIQYYVLIVVGGLLLTLVACFYIYNKFRSMYDTSQEKRGSGEIDYDVRQLERRLSALEARLESDTSELWKANERITDKILDIHSIVGEVRGIISSRRSERD